MLLDQLECGLPASSLDCAAVDIMKVVVHPEQTKASIEINHVCAAYSLICISKKHLAWVKVRARLNQVLEGCACIDITISVMVGETTGGF